VLYKAQKYCLEVARMNWAPLIGLLQPAVKLVELYFQFKKIAQS